MRQQRPLARRPHARHIVQRRRADRLGPFRPVGADGKPVHLVAQPLLERAHCRVERIGLSEASDWSARDVERGPGGTTFRLIGAQRDHGTFELPMAGEHNVSNALAAIAVAVELGASPDQVRDSLKAFGGVKRRFTPVGEWNGVKIIDDYAHHPVEIMACLKAARAIQGQGRVIAISQPHRYSRLQDLFEEFAQCYREADIAVITPVFAAGEAPIDGIDHAHLVESMLGHGHKQAQVLDDLETLPQLVRELAEPGDMVVCMGAGSISAHANKLIERLKS